MSLTQDIVTLGRRRYRCQGWVADAPAFSSDSRHLLLPLGETRERFGLEVLHCGKQGFTCSAAFTRDFFRKAEHYACLPSGLVSTWPQGLLSVGLRGGRVPSGRKLKIHGSAEAPAVLACVSSGLAALALDAQEPLFHRLRVFDTRSWQVLSSARIELRPSARFVRLRSTGVAAEAQFSSPIPGVWIISQQGHALQRALVATTALGECSQPALSWDGRWLALSQDGAVLMVSIRSGALLYQHAVPSNCVPALAWTAALALLVCSRNTGLLLIEF